MCCLSLLAARVSFKNYHLVYHLKPVIYSGWMWSVLGSLLFKSNICVTVAYYFIIKVTSNMLRYITFARDNFR